MKTSLFYLPDLGTREEREAGMAGMRPDLYQRMLSDLSEQAKLADRLGYNSISFTEHHFHIEASSASSCRQQTRCASPKTSPCWTT